LGQQKYFILPRTPLEKGVFSYGKGRLKTYW